MKKTTKMSVFSGAITALLLLGGYGTALGQGTMNFYTYPGVVNSNLLARVFQYDGITLASGTTFSAQLFGSTSSNGVYSAISPVTTFLTGGYAGYINYGAITVGPGAGYSPGDTFWYELFVWTASAGSYTNAMVTGGAQYGLSHVEALTLGGGIFVPQNTAGFPNLTLTLAPEPTTLALVGLGGLSLLLFRRKNS